MNDPGRRGLRRGPCRAVVWLFAVQLCTGLSVRAADRVAFSTVRQIVADGFASQQDYQSGDLIWASHVRPILESLAAVGWRPQDRAQILADLLQEEDALVRALNTRQGRQFMRKVSGHALIYDRLDRIVRVPGGERLVHDLIRLPDGERYAPLQPPRGVPTLVDLLPKNRSGKTRKITDYRKATGRIYTQEALMKRLEESWTGKSQPRQQAAVDRR
ncbi:MAG: hypothetical protein FJ276_31140 [Planctomycetes bacterium]|nr:hypothetical protein [Planctomycetota bacterium]